VQADFWYENLKGRGNQEDLDVHRMIILKWILERRIAME
jgi:hypothetical protein